MQIKIIIVGKIRDRNLAVIVNNYLKRLNYYATTKIIVVKEMKISEGRSDREILKKESERIKEKIDSRDYLIVLHRRGTFLSSKSFAEFINTQMTCGNSFITFILGGPLGLDEELLSDLL